MIIHTVTPGQTVYSIAALYGVTPGSIITANALQSPDRLVAGQDLVVPAEGRAHTVTAGESLYTIARQYDLTVDALLRANPTLQAPYVIYPGQILLLPAGGKLGAIEVNGYCYPNINRTVLEQTLPYLTYLSIFSYRVLADGSLTEIDDEPLIEAARTARVAPMMVITNTRESGGFDSDLVHTLLTDEAVTERMLTQVLDVLRQKGYHGLDVDFEYIPPADREAYNAFLELAAGRLRAEGFILSTAIAPKVRADQQGTLYEAHDYAFHGGVVDHVILMTYEWGYLYGPPMAVAPIGEVRRVLDYAVTAIPPEKILMGMPNYAYDWTLPYTPGTAAQYLSVQGAVNRAVQYGAEIQFSPAAQAPFFEYTTGGQRHIVWFENARSTRARLGLVREYGLLGVSYWTINTFFPQNWLVLESMYDIVKL